MLSTNPEENSSLSRRDALRLLGGLGAVALAGPVRGAATAVPPTTVQPFVLPPLGFAVNALAPLIDARTMEIHHGKHHQAYIDNANKALREHPQLQRLSGEALMADLSAVPETIRTAVRNNVGGHLNHALFWRLLVPGGSRSPGQALGLAIASTFGSVDVFKTRFVEASLARFGSGWAWLIWQRGQLRIVSTANQDSPISDGAVPLIGLDVWEHAYYLTYQNRRADYAKAFWDLLNWSEVDRRFSEARV